MKYSLVFLFAIVCCSISIAQPQGVVGPHLLVYKTKRDYKNLVPINLSTDKKSIANYPDPLDIKHGGESTRPTELHNGYLIDNRGISENVAFLKMSYQQFANLPAAPTHSEMLDNIKDKNPLIVLCDCGLKNSKSIDELNDLIDKNKLLSTCKIIKGKHKKRNRNK